MRLLARTPLCILALAISAHPGGAQVAPYQRTFAQKTPASVEKALKDLQATTAGRLPVLEGFVVPGNRSLDRFQRAYYQCTVRVSASPLGGTVVQVSAKITAWYNDPDAAKSGYQVLPSNGRLESDLLDRLAEVLSAAGGPLPAPATAGSTPAQPGKTNAPAPTLSAPMPQETIPGEPIAASKSSAPSASSSFKVTTPASAATESMATRTAIADKHAEELNKEAKNLEEILRSQAHPNNLAAVRKSGTPVVVSPNEGAKVLFLATAEDEFEILDLNASWVHVRISGISRGWIRRSSLELPEESPEPEPAPTKAPAATSASSGPPFEVEREEITSFPGTWTPLRGKTVKIVSVQTAASHGADDNPQTKLQFAKSLFGREYAELTKESSTAAGVVVVFDSADGGMVAATLAVLQQWKEGNLSDEGFWHRCYFDPPGMFGSSASQ